MLVLEASELAQSKGCILKAMLADETSLYWIEHPHFTSRPFSCLNEVVQFLQKLPGALPTVEEICEEIAVS